MSAIEYQSSSVERSVEDEQRTDAGVEVPANNTASSAHETLDAPSMAVQIPVPLTEAPLEKQGTNVTKESLDDDQAARYQAEDEMGELLAKTLFKKSLDVLPIPNMVTKGVTKGVGTVFSVMDIAVDHIPRPVTDLANFAGDNVRLLAATTGAVIEAAPDLLIGAIPEFIMSKDTKQLFFVDFSNTLRSFFHTNILAMPYVFNETGLLTGLALTTFVAACSLYATETFMRAKNQLPDPKKVITYGDVPRLIFGDWYPSINIFYGIIHLISFEAFAARNFQVLLHSYGYADDAYLLGLMIPAVAALPLVFMKEAHQQRPLSIISNTVIFLCVVILLAYFPYNRASDTQKSTSGGRLIIALGIVVYAFTGIGSAVPVERTMDPMKYIKLLRVAVLVSSVLLITFGIAGYVSYGQGTCAVITLSLQSGQTKTALSAMLFMASVIIIPQQVFPLAEVIDRRLLGLRSVPRYWDRAPNLARIGAIFGSALVAYLIPFYGLILSIGGSVACGIIGLIVPAGLDYARRRYVAVREHRGVGVTEYFMIVAMAGFGMFTLVAGVLFALYDMWFKLQQGSDAGASKTCGV